MSLKDVGQRPKCWARGSRTCRKDLTGGPQLSHWGASWGQEALPSRRDPREAAARAAGTGRGQLCTAGEEGRTVGCILGRGATKETERTGQTDREAQRRVG